MPRAFLGTSVHASGADLKAVQGPLGHSTPTMTMHYIPADLHAMRAAVKRWGRAASRATAGRGRRKPRTQRETPDDWTPLRHTRIKAAITVIRHIACSPFAMRPLR